MTRQATNEVGTHRIRAPWPGAVRNRRLAGLLCAAALLTPLMAGCGASSSAPLEARAAVTPEPVSQWPNAGTYNALKVAIAVRNSALRDHDWERKAYGAELALLTLTHPIPRLAPGRC